MDSYRSFFKQVTAFKPYDFQEKLFKEYSNSKNILLKAPTGAGKTWASILPFAYNIKQKTVSPKKLVYSLPLRTLANSLYDNVSKNNIIKEMGLNVSLQTGELPGDKLFEADIIFTTIDQTLSSILGFPYSLSKRQSNINAGAIIGSYLIFDEFHLLDPAKSLTTSLNILKKLKEISRFCIMTATISNNTIKEIDKFLGSIPIVLDDNELNSIVRLKNKKNITVVKREVRANDILKEHKKKTMVICNTVERAQKLYLELEKKKKTNTELICIHARFLKKDRMSKEKKIINIFGKDKNANPNKEAILISTQVIEVGLDISCDTLHTEISPINSFLQRAGRCARFENEEGKIFVYDVKENKNGNKSYLPYKEELCTNTMKELEKKKYLNFVDGEKIVDTVLTDKEVTEIKNAKSFAFERIKKAWEDNDKRNGRELIRDVNSVNVIFLRKPDAIHSMYDYDAISIRPDTLVSKLKKIENQSDDEEREPLVSIIEENNIFVDSEMTKFMMTSLENIEDIKFYPRIVLNPKYVSYNKKVGLNFLLNGKAEESTIQETDNKELFGYKKEIYEEHITNMIKIYETDFKNKAQYSLSKLWNKYNFVTSIDGMIKFMIIMHDYGKLNKKWQRIARNFQRTKKNYTGEELLAHTDFDPKKDKLPEKLPPHAGIGAIVTLTILENVIQNNREYNTIARALISAILKHHSTSSHKVNTYRIEDKGIGLVSYMIKNYTPSFYKFNTNNRVIKEGGNIKDLSQYTVDFNNPDETFLYFILVRILRLCDQKSMSREDIYVSK
jgi:CRISPR-associated endonuclease/helicase Cas3